MISLVLMILAIICFLLSAVGVSSPRVNLEALGLFFLASAMALGNISRVP